MNFCSIQIVSLFKIVSLFTDSEYDTDDSDTEVETTEPTVPANKTNTTKPRLAVKTDRTVTPAGPDATKARADFFTSPPEPLRLDPFKMFGMARKSDIGTQQKNDQEKEKVENPVVAQAVNQTLGELESDEGPDKEDTIKNMGELLLDREEKSSISVIAQVNSGNTLGEIESDEGTDNQVLILSLFLLVHVMFL